MSFLVTTQTIQRSMTQLSVLFGQAIKGYTAGARVFEVRIVTRLREFVCTVHQRAAVVTADWWSSHTVSFARR
jgi:hypothetical protein